MQVANKYAAMAQEVERILGKDEVTSSTLVSSSKKKRHDFNRVFSFCVCERKDTTSFARLLATSFSRRLTSFRFSGHKTRLPSANSVVLRTNDVGYRPTMLHFVQTLRSALIFHRFSAIIYPRR